MQWLKSRRLHFLLAGTLAFFILFSLLRLVFLFGFSDIDAMAFPDVEALLKTLGVGFRFDLRLAILVMLPLAVLLYLPKVNMLSSGGLRLLGRAYLLLATVVLLLVYIIDFGHYNYLGTRINATVFRFAGNVAISGEMLWQSYPVVWITLGWLATIAVMFGLMRRVERVTLDRPPARIGKPAIVFGSLVMVVLTFLGLLGRVTNINIENPVPLRWNDAFFSGDPDLAAVGLNPIIYLYDTASVPVAPYDREQVERYYPLTAQYLGVERPDVEALDFERRVGVQPHRLQTERPPNVVFVMLESLGASRVGAYGNPLNPTPSLDAIAENGWFFEHFYVPVTGTAKTVWASITGIPDVSREETASRNPLITHQRTIINAFENYRKVYLVGGNSGWANIDALIRQSIDGVTLYEEGDWKGLPLVDVWGISDLDLFKESDRILRALPDDRPFFAYIQTAANHRPFTIPEDNDGFESLQPPAAELHKYGFKSAAQYNAVRLLDFNIGRFLEMARDSSYFDNTIFVFFGDHNNRITTLSHMPPAFEKLGLESNHVPHMIYAPKLLEPRVIEEAVSLVDMLPTVAGLAGIEYTTQTTGRDIQLPAPEGERVVPLVLIEGSFPVIGALTRDFLVQMNYDGSEPTLHDLASETPMQNVAAQHPEEFERLKELARGLYETSRFMLYQNAIDRGKAKSAKP